MTPEQRAEARALVIVVSLPSCHPSQHEHVLCDHLTHALNQIEADAVTIAELTDGQRCQLCKGPHQMGIEGRQRKGGP